jgi:F0F1-type ATP synthase membrane subunit b/b'
MFNRKLINELRELKLNVHAWKQGFENAFNSMAEQIPNDITQLRQDCAMMAMSQRDIERRLSDLERQCRNIVEQHPRILNQLDRVVSFLVTQGMP